MPKLSRSASLVLGILLLGAACIISLPLLLLFGMYALDYEVPMLLQDCNGISIHLSGTVQGISGALVKVEGEDGLYPESGGMDLTLTTDVDGSFDSGDTRLHAFACEVLTITVSAVGFEPLQMRYSLLDHFSEDALGAQMAADEPLPVVLDIELETA